MTNNKLLIISGVGYIGSEDITFDSIKNKNTKINMGLATALEAAKYGYDLFLVSLTEKKLKTIQKLIAEQFPSINVYYKAIDATNRDSVLQLDKVLKTIEFNSIGYVHSLGLSSGVYAVDDNNPYHLINELDGQTIIKEYESVVNSLLYFMQLLLPIFKKQRESNVCVINSMSGIRAFPYGFSHSAAKGGLHNAVRSLCLELHKDNIFISEVLPGLVDTGYYDNNSVKHSIKEIVKFFGYDWDDLQELPMIDPSDIAKVVVSCLTSNGHILSVNMVSKGQIPHMGS